MKWTSHFEAKSI